MWVRVHPMVTPDNTVWFACVCAVEGPRVFVRKSRGSLWVHPGEILESLTDEDVARLTDVPVNQVRTIGEILVRETRVWRGGGNGAVDQG